MKKHRQIRLKYSKDNNNQHYASVKYAKLFKLAPCEHPAYFFRKINRKHADCYYYEDDNGSPFEQRHGTGWKYSTRRKRQWRK